MSGDLTEAAGGGLVGRFAGVVYWFVVLDLLMALACVPTLVVPLLLERDVSNLPLYALCALPVGPAIAAAVFAWRDFTSARDERPAVHFWRGYRLNLVDSLRVWLLALAAFTVLGMNIGHGAVTGPSAVVSIALCVVVAVWTGHALVISALFSFRFRDTARLAVFYLGSLRATSGVVALLIVAVGAVALAADYVLAFAGSILTWFLWNNSARIVADVQRRFLAPADA